MSDLSNWRNDTVLYEYHVKKGWSAGRIANEAEVPVALVEDYLENRDMLNAETGQVAEQESEEHTCPDCGEKFESVDEWADHHQSEHYNWEVHRMEQF
ncbi:hypothetical protein PNP85_04610 [Halobacterium salinarum]|uniref:hypothetical protein n=1 Tax=Halobacterium salinarum TaxID=2242 RepID=UPI002555C9B0|nr:hypothetical protein [Halobacterium salinarum]MDL0129289.1 hypothetical protein [Halobacterium salinarum]MDL0138786.1 hypothetical protein [Halobacterium salinarum]